MPALTESAARDLTKVVRHAGEKRASRCATCARCQRTRQTAAEGQGDWRDEERRSLDEVQKMTDRTIAEIDRLVAAKEAEIAAI